MGPPLPLPPDVCAVLDKFAREPANQTKLIGRIVALESRPGIRFCGVWEAGTDYDVDDYATSGGPVWHCNRETRTKPGASQGWTLAVKRGRDGKDARK